MIKLVVEQEPLVIARLVPQEYEPHKRSLIEVIVIPRKQALTKCSKLKVRTAIFKVAEQ